MDLNHNCKVVDITGLTRCETNDLFKIEIATKNVNLLYEPELLNLILTEIKLRSLILDEIDIYAFCILPYHISMVLSMKEHDVTLAQWVKKFKAYITRNSVNKKLWRPKYKFEKVDTGMLSNKCHEVVMEPENLGLVTNWNEYGLAFKA